VTAADCTSPAPTDEIVALAQSIRSVPPPIAVLAGSGTSSSAGVTTGQDLLARIARERGEQPESDPVGWYIRTFGVFPNYIRMLQEAGGPDADPLALPTAFFEAFAGKPNTPTPAHRALAAMAASGLVAPILTTNFDRLLETALVDAGVPFDVIFDLDSMARVIAEPDLAARRRKLLVKLHGDYKDIRIRDTSGGFATYHPIIDALLDRVVADFDLLVCGWSASWDIPLYRALERGANMHRRTFWLQRGTLTPAAARLIAARRAEVVAVPSSDKGLTALTRALGVTVRGPADQSR